MGKHSSERRSALPLILAGAAVLAIAVTAFLLVRVFGSATAPSTASPAGASSTTGTSTPTSTSSSTPASSTSSPATATGTTVAGTSSAAPSPSADAVAAQAALKACVDRQTAAKPMVDSIATGAGHWSDHVQAQTDLTAGTRSLIDVTTNTWGPTRSAGPGDVGSFQTAYAGYVQLPGCSTEVGAIPAPAEITPRLQACAAREAALDNVVTVGTRVMGDWRTHLTEMADHADGHINSAQAQASWLKRWAASGTNLTPYKAAVASLAAAPACTV